MPDDVSSQLYTLTFEQRPEYLYAYVEGQHDTYEISLSFWQRVFDEVVRVGARRVLVDENIVESASMADMFRIASDISEMGFGSTRVAFVDRYLDQEDLNQFGELVAINRGMNGKIFNDVETAVAWLTRS